MAAALGKDFDELYRYDGLDRLKHMDRGRLNATKAGMTTTTFSQCWTLDETGNWRKFRQDDDGDGTWDLKQTRTANKVNEITHIATENGSSSSSGLSSSSLGSSASASSVSSSSSSSSSSSGGTGWVTPAYDSAGNMTTIPQPTDPAKSHTATYDPWNRLVKLTDGTNTVQENECDALGRRVTREDYTAGTLDEIRHFYYTAGWQVIEERVNTSTVPERHFVWGIRYIDDLVCCDRDTDANGTLDERLYALQDGNWNVTAVTNTSGDGQERYAYDSYGTPIFLDASFGARTSSNYDWETLYAGYRWDENVALYHVRNRVYHPELGNWIQRDPTGYDAGDPNLYRYVNGRPTNDVDPSGKVPPNWEPRDPRQPMWPGGPIPADVPRAPKTPDSICANMKCTRCSPAQCRDLLKKVRDAAKQVPAPSGLNKCEKWEKWEKAFEDYLRKNPIGLNNNSCVKESGVTSFKWFVPTAGHAAYKITLCDGNVWYVDFGATSIGGSGSQGGVGAIVPAWMWGEGEIPWDVPLIPWY